MLTGRLAFGGETTSDTLAAVLEREPDWSVLPAGAPVRLRGLLEDCLTRDPKQRLRDIGDARIVIDRLLGVHPATCDAGGAASRQVGPVLAEGGSLGRCGRRLCRGGVAARTLASGALAHAGGTGARGEVFSYATGELALRVRRQ